MSRAKPLKSRTPGPDRDTYVAVSGYQGCKHGPIRSVPGHANASIGLGGGLARHGTGSAMMVCVQRASRPDGHSPQGQRPKAQRFQGLSPQTIFLGSFVGTPRIKRLNGLCLRGCKAPQDSPTRGNALTTKRTPARKGDPSGSWRPYKPNYREEGRYGHPPYPSTVRGP
jgi:hypothetical protein